MAYTTIDDPSEYFQIALYTGNGTAIGSGGLTITNDGNSDLKPDWIWHKKRGSAESHAVADSNRGTHKGIFPNETNAESSGGSQYVNSFNTDGFTVGNVGWANDSGQTYVAWQWKCNGGTTSSNTDGSITSTVQANTTAGFSIVTYTGTGSSSTAGHGLNSTPEVIISKARNATQDWAVHTTIIDGSMDFLLLNNSNAKSDSSFSSPTSTVFPTRTTNNYVAYIFHSVEGYSKFGKYTGNGNADGTFVYTGFRPALVICKKTSAAENWNMTDSKRSTFNVCQAGLSPSTNAAEDTTNGVRIDLLSNGFKARDTAGQYNDSGASYIYMAFAENPFVSSKGVPTTAR